MKPVYLRFSGLHSYTEEQKIDFTSLLGAGVFGIFGPTGSGKSTILDAITLALYGMVERAANRTQGIINQYCRQAAVAFTFELIDAEGTHRFLVERTFRNGKTTGSVEAVQARLVELCQGTTGWEDHGVLADKATTVTERVVEILGLSQNDFTRAVVLPQGKFAEFLTLGGRDRRSMLQRLFGLELYGDQLLQQVKAELQVGDTALQKVQASRTELGDASPAAVEAAAQSVRAAELAKEQAVQTATALEAKVTNLARIWQWQTELEHAQQQLHSLAQNAAAQQALEQELADAERAERVRGVLTAVTTAEVAVKTAETVWQEACLQAAAAETEMQNARVQRTQAEQVWRAESPQIYARQADLRRAADLEGVRHKIRQGLAEAARAVETAKAELTEIQRTSAEAAAAGEQAQVALARLRSEIQQRTIIPAERNRVSAALAALNRLADAEKNLAKERQRASREEAAWHQAATQLKQSAALAEQADTARKAVQMRLDLHLRAQPHTADELAANRKQWQNCARLADQVNNLFTSLTAAQNEEAKSKIELAETVRKLAQTQASRDAAQAALAAARRNLTNAEKAVLDVQHADMAATLAATLGAGQPCPVCGSKHHPAPTIAQNPALLATLAKTAEAARVDLAQAEEALSKANEIWAKATSEQQSIANACVRVGEERERLASQLQKLVTSLPIAWQECGAAELRQAVQQAETQLQEQEAALENWQQARQMLEHELHQATIRAAEADKQQAANCATVTAAQKAGDQANLRVEEATTQWEALQAEVAQLLSGQTEKEIIALGEQYFRWDHEVVELRSEEERWLMREKEAAVRLQTCQQAETQMQTQKIHAEEGVKRLADKLSDLEQEITAIIGPEASAVAELAAVTRRLEQLAHAQDVAKAQEAAADNAFQLAARARSSAEERRTLASQSWQTAKEQLVEALIANGFNSAAQAQTALRPQAQQDQMQSQIRIYQQDVSHWQHEYERLKASLAGQSLSADEWQHWQERLADARIQRDTAIAHAAVAAKEYNDLMQRHARWMALAKEEAALSNRIGRLQDLSSLLRGNAFVDFLAEQQLQQVAWEASAHLGQLTRYRYALEVTSDGSFIIRDDASGGYKRAVHTLSGGETFLTSLALALALSAQIQLRGRYPLQFFFLDEGFGSLDQELLDEAMSALEKLNLAKLHVGVISHVPELRNRILHRLLVEPAVPGIQGSRVTPDYA